MGELPQYRLLRFEAPSLLDMLKAQKAGGDLTTLSGDLK
jgi:hypothetical protein